MSPQAFSVVDLFSGAGGMSFGFAELAPHYELIAAVDKQVGKPGTGVHAGTRTDCNRTYSENLGLKPLDLDLSDFPADDLPRELGLDGDVDVLIACPPCTGFSQKAPENHRKDDPRNSLVTRVVDFAAALKPAYLVMENVPGLVSGPHGHHFLHLQKGLRKRNYKVWFDILDMSEYGLPQRRRRLILIACKDKEIPPLPNHPSTPMTVRDAIEHLPPVTAGEEHPKDPMHVSPSMTEPVLRRMRAIPSDGGSWRDILENPQLSDEEKRELLIPSMLNGRRNSFPDVYGRLRWDRPAITITRECAHVGNGRFAHPEQDRLLTVREMALLQGFPPDYEFKGALRAKYNQIGDAVPPSISIQIAAHILQLEGRSL